MTAVNIAQPDVTLFMDMDGVIQRAALSDAIAGESIEGWVGRPWGETVGDGGGDKVRRMVEDARSTGVSAYRQLDQRFPSGLELPMEYMTVRLGAKQGLIAIGKSMQAVAELQSRLVAAQQAMERDYWKLREVETRYRLLFDASHEAVLLIRASTLRIVEANPAAIRALGLAPSGREFLQELAPQDRDAFQAMLMRVRDNGKAPGILGHLGRDRQPWLLRASLMAAEPGPLFMVQLAPVGATLPAARQDEASIEALIERVPDGFVVIDRDGVISRANSAFLDLVQVSGKPSVIGEHLGRWLEQPGADLSMLKAHVERYGAIRLFSTTLRSELGAETPVEISAAGDSDPHPSRIALVIRNVALRLPHAPDTEKHSNILDLIGIQIGKTPLKSVVRDAVEVVERHSIERALELTSGNRTAAAGLLSLSRQSLYAKLNRYELDGGDQSDSQ